MAFTMLLAVLQRAYRSAADRAVAHIGVSHALAWPLLMVGRQGNGVRQGQIAELLGIEGPSLVRLLDQLVAADLVERHDDPADRRVRTLHLTAAGRAAQGRIEQTLHRLRQRLFDGVPELDVQACLRVFATLEQRLDCVIPGVRDRTAPE
jgi:MarR family transcriptional regulator, transcriptional regulator for hemolysin